jgi:two-component system phosphate regulon response regulator OmpR
MERLMSTESQSQTATNGSAAPSVPDDAAHLLVVDDDNRIRTLLHRFLSTNGYRVTMADSAEAASRQLNGMAFDLIILDVMMPGQSGLSFAAQLRETSEVPILMLTARAETDHRIEGLEAGVDDYLGKPFEPRELLLRVSAILRRRQPDDDDRGLLSFGPFTFDPDRGELKRHGEIVRLTDREREFLTIFSTNPNDTVPRHELAGEDGSERAVDVQINRLRRKLEVDPANPMLLQTVRGLGYRLNVT